MELRNGASKAPKHELLSTDSTLHEGGHLAWPKVGKEKNVTLPADATLRDGGGNSSKDLQRFDWPKYKKINGQRASPDAAARIGQSIYEDVESFGNNSFENA